MGDTEVGDTPASSSNVPEPQESETTKDETKAEEEDSKPKASPSPSTLPSMLTLDQVYRNIAYLKTKDQTPDIALKIASLVQCAPYMPQDMKKEIMALAKAYQSASVAYSSALKAFSSASEEDKNTEEPLIDQLAKKNAQLALYYKKDVLKGALDAKKDAFWKLNGFQSEIVFMQKSYDLVKTTLQECATLSQAEKSFSQSEKTSALRDKKNHSDDDASKDDPGATEVLTNKGQVLGGERPSARELYKKKLVLDHNGFMSSSDRNEPPPGLEMVADKWSSWIMHSKIVPGTGSKEDTQAIEAVIKEIRETIQSPNDSPKPEANRPNRPFASYLSQEVACTQPIFVGLLELIGDCCDVCNNSDGYSQPKTQIMTSQIIPGTESRPKRIVDVCLDKPGCFRIDTKDTAQKLTCELKPLLRKSQSSTGLHHESFHQLLGHLAKYVKNGLDLWGCGASTWATGLTATVAYITVYRLDLFVSELKERATDFLKLDQDSPEFKALASRVAKLQLSESIKLPLMTLACFNEWVIRSQTQQTKKNPECRKKEIEKLRKDLYGDDILALDDKSIPIGIWFLWNLMMNRRSDLFGPSYQDIIRSHENKRIGKLLGTGSYGLVFNYGEDEKSDEVLKVPRLQNCVHLKKEIEILKRLGREQAPNTTINDQLSLPVLNQVIDHLTVELGGVTRDLQGMVLSPKGTPMLSWVREARLGEQTGEFFNSVVDQLEVALKFMHDESVYHNDVSPKNIIVHSRNKADWRVCLVDFGSASGPESQNGFVGTSLYAHKDIFECHPEKPWKSHSDYDFFGLGLTICVLLNAGKTCWDMNPFPAALGTADSRDQLDEKVKNRRSAATSTIERSNCSVEVKDKLLKWISLEGLADEDSGVSAPAADTSPSRLHETEPEPSPKPWMRMNLRSTAAKRKATSLIDPNAKGTSVPPGASAPHSGGLFSKFVHRTKQRGKKSPPTR